MSEGKVNWSELSPDLLRCVLERLSFTDFHQAKSVCSSWHSAWRGCVPKRNQIPWLILFPREDNDNKSSCVLFIPDNRNRVYRTRDLGVDFVRSCCLATYGTWLLMMDPKWNLNILNPLTGERIDLPLTEPVVPERSSHGLKSSVVCLWVDEKTKDYLVVWTLDQWLQVTKKGNDNWRRVSCNYGITESAVHMVYKHKIQMLYVYSNGETSREAVDIWSFRGDDPKHIFSIFFSVKKREKEVLLFQDLVDGWANIATSASTSVSRQVLKVFRVAQRFKGCLLSILMRQDFPNHWGKMDSLGDEALILDMGINVVAEDIPGIKKNSIYFSGIGHGRKNPDNIFVFDLTTNKIESLPQCVYSINFSDARWFFPGLND